jgi:hypothetical protein
VWIPKPLVPLEQINWKNHENQIRLDIAYLRALTGPMAACSDDTKTIAAGLYLDYAVISTKVRAVFAADSWVNGRDIGVRTDQCAVDMTGEGLPSEKLAQFFQPFNRLDRENTAEEGTAIGPVVSKRPAQWMGGTIGVQSVVGVGSECSVDLAQGDRPEESWL